MSPKFYRNIQNTFCLRNILQYPLYSAVSLIRRTSSACSVVSASCLRSTCPRILRCPHPHSPHGPGSMPRAGRAATGSGEELYTLFSSATDCARISCSLRLLPNCPVSSSNEKAAECNGAGAGPLQAGCRAAMKVGSGEEGGEGGTNKQNALLGLGLASWRMTVA